MRKVVCDEVEKLDPNKAVCLYRPQAIRAREAAAREAELRTLKGRVKRFLKSWLKPVGLG